MESVAKEYGKSDKVVKAVLNSVIGTEEIVVEKSLNGKYRILEGMHRAYVAKKCGYKLLVRVKQEEVKKSG